MEIFFIFNPVFLNALKQLFFNFYINYLASKKKNQWVLEQKLKLLFEEYFSKKLSGKKCFRIIIFKIIFIFELRKYDNVSFVKISCPQRWGHTGFFIFMFPFVFCQPNFNLVFITSESCNTKDVPPVGVYIKTLIRRLTQTQTRMTKYFCVLNVHCVS